MRPAHDPEAAAARLEAHAPSGDAVAVLKMSGGTTGLPKMVARTHNDLAYMAQRAAEISGFGRGTVYLRREEAVTTTYQ